MLKRLFAVLAVAGAMLVTAGPAGAVITYNGHAGVQDGTSNTVIFGIAADGRGADFIGMPDMGGQWWRSG
jgi:hypothetical protein